MNLIGFVPLRRGIIAHTQNGNLSNTECLVLIYLIMLANKSTGAGTINAPTLRTFLPGLSYDAAKRVLLALEEKRYIFRRIVPFSKLVYQYWVNRYTPTVGRYKSLQCNLAKVFESRSVKDIEYVQPVPEDAPEAAPDGALAPPLHYKKGEQRSEKRQYLSPNSGVCGTECKMPQNTVSRASQLIVQRKSGQGSALPGVAQGSAHLHQPLPAPLLPSVRDAAPAGDGLKWDWGHPLPGYIFRCGEDAGYWCSATGRRISYEEAQREAARSLEFIPQ